jgi:hypothetical protein
MNPYVHEYFGLNTIRMVIFWKLDRKLDHHLRGKVLLRGWQCLRAYYILTYFDEKPHDNIVGVASIYMADQAYQLLPFSIIIDVTIVQFGSDLN